jgi:Fuc2NAc and GlcNAc transferase
MTSALLLVPLLAGAVAFAITSAVRRYAIARAIVDRPNERSLHERPVPRGGGIAIVLTFLIGMLLLAAAGIVPVRLALALLGGASVALVGWVDDRLEDGVSAAARAATHFAAAIWALAWLGGLDRLWIGGGSIGLGIAGSVLAVIGTVWWINLYNFMDGIDGLAGGQAVTVAATAGGLSWLAGHPSAAGPAFLLAGAAGGFLILNWTPARIFMGDVGSGFLGFAFAVLAIGSEKAGTLPLLIWLLLSGVFLFDATVTLLRRIARGERWHAAHRSHAYQRLVLSGRSHGSVTAAVLLLNGVLSTIAYFSMILDRPLAGLALGLAILALLYLGVERIQPMAPVTRSGAPADRDIPADRHAGQ